MLSQKKAWKEAQKRWGQLGNVVDRLRPYVREGVVLMRRYSVGRIANVGGIEFFVVKGTGDSWEEAFKRADSIAGGV
jgi:hypothetical protein